MDGIVLVVLVAMFAVATHLLVHGLGGETVGSVFILLAFLIVLLLPTEDGQTVVKKELGIRIVKMDIEENGGFVSNVLLRLIVNGLIGIIPFYSLVDRLFIFRNDSRCIHDLIAGTQIVGA